MASNAAHSAYFSDKIHVKFEQSNLQFSVIL